MQAAILAMGVVICVAGFAIASYNVFLFGTYYFPYALVGAIVLLIGFVTSIIGFIASSPENIKHTVNNPKAIQIEPIEILKIRYAKGEITKAEYEAVKKELES